MISKELLSEVLGTGIIQMPPIQEGNMIGYLVYGNQNTLMEIRSNHKRINTHELANKCINHFYDDYIFSLNAYQVIITKIEIGKDPIEVHSICWIDIPYDVKYTFQACQWILDNKEKVK